MSDTIVLNTPIGDLEWVTIDGAGKDDMNGVPHFWATLVLDPDGVDENTSEARKKEHSEFKSMLEKYWDDNKPKGNYEIKGGIKPHKVPTGEKDEDGDNIYEETGKYQIVVKTKTQFEDKQGNIVDKKIKIFNAKGAEVSLGDKKIGNGSKGRIGLAMRVFTAGKGKAISAAGLSFYLNKIQLSKFVEYTGDGFDALDESLEEGEDFEGIGEMGAVLEESSAQSEKPRLD